MTSAFCVTGASGEPVCRPRATVAHRMEMAVGPPCPSYWTFWIAWTRSGEGDHHVTPFSRACDRAMLSRLNGRLRD